MLLNTLETGFSKFIVVNSISKSGAIYTVPDGRKCVMTFISSGSECRLNINGVEMAINSHPPFTLTIPAGTVISTVNNAQRFTLVGYEI